MQDLKNRGLEKEKFTLLDFFSCLAIICFIVACCFLPQLVLPN